MLLQHNSFAHLSEMKPPNMTPSEPPTNGIHSIQILYALSLTCNVLTNQFFTWYPHTKPPAFRTPPATLSRIRDGDLLQYITTSLTLACGKSCK